ncbi:MoxR family ATPase [Shewanella sp. NIFS-20-20]|uniref:AAA family ATPase n=1 Tax=Shewanella sp. NIFS-20-20 TaxID=2853806 RepID=UPI001C43A88F|nr:MoxR family ATPase [Shewanella sp. NIFS-20-20]
MNNQLDGLINQLQQVLLGKPQAIKLALACILARGNLLIEDLPGMGKTSLAHAIAASLGLSYQRIQFTSDMLPADILGVTLFDKQDSQFVFHPGPIFHQMVLADEINRASPKTQSALLEAMAERQVTLDGKTHRLPSPFFVIATQNPSEQSGTFMLPESQLDRFMMRISLGYPDNHSEMLMLKSMNSHIAPSTLAQCLSPTELVALQQRVEQVSASDALLRYLLALVHASRQDSQVTGLSPRASKALLQAAKAWAVLENRDYILPEDLQAVFVAVSQHRLRSHSDGQGDTWCQHILTQVNPIR